MAKDKWSAKGRSVIGKGRMMSVGGRVIRDKIQTYDEAKDDASRFGDRDHAAQNLDHDVLGGDDAE
jgi:hypothetical protein